MPDDKPPMQPQPPTARLEQSEILKGLLASFQEEVRDGFRNVLTELSTVSGDVRDVRSRVVTLERWKSELEAKPLLTSDRVREVTQDTKSKTDLDLEKSLSAVAEKVLTVETTVARIEAETGEQTVILRYLQTEAKALLRSPLAKKVAYAVGGAIVAYLTSKGLHL